MKKEQFDVVLADDETSQRIHYQLRYQVFCLDTGYEDPKCFPDGEERDEWDDNAIHFIVRERETRQWVAAMRFVFPQSNLLPIGTRAHLSPDIQPPSDQILEVSRLCMVGHYRRRPQQSVVPPRSQGNVTSLFPAGSSPAHTQMSKRMRTAEMLRSLLIAGLAYSADCGARHWYIFTTRALAKVLGYVLPLDLQQVGQPVWHRGERFPFLVDIGPLVEKMVRAGTAAFAQERRPAYYRHSELMTATLARAVGAS